MSRSSLLSCCFPFVQVVLPFHLGVVVFWIIIVIVTESYEIRFERGFRKRREGYQHHQMKQTKKHHGKAAVRENAPQPWEGGGRQCISELQLKREKPQKKNRDRNSKVTKWILLLLAWGNVQYPFLRPCGGEFFVSKFKYGSWVDREESEPLERLNFWMLDVLNTNTKYSNVLFLLKMIIIS